MNPQDLSPSASDSAIVERLAVEVMGWVKGFEDDGRLYWSTGENAMQDTWNPLTDWNHWRQVEEKVMGMQFDHLFFRLITMRGRNSNGFVNYIESDLPTRCRALLAALDSLKKE